MTNNNFNPQIVAALELLLFLGCVPLLALTGPGHALRHALLLAGCAYAVWRLSGRVPWRFLFARPPYGWWIGPLLRGLLVLLCAVWYISDIAPALLFRLPMERPGIWLLILLSYPPLSALPQELIYRVYLFEAHPSLWRNRFWPYIITSALSFGWAHVIFAGWLAMGLTALGGLLLGLTYRRARSRPGAVWSITLEHSLYGLALFTVGLGRYFWEGK